MGFLFLILYPGSSSSCSPPLLLLSSASSSLSHNNLVTIIFHISVTHNFVTIIFHTHLCHTSTLSHIHFVTHLCHISTLSHTIFNHRLSHTSLSTHHLKPPSLTHTHLCHTPCFAHNSVNAAVCVAGVALCHIHLPYAWQAWQFVTSTFVLSGRRGTCGTGLALVARLGWDWSPVSPRHFTLSHLSFSVAGVALLALGWLRWRAWAGFGAVTAVSGMLWCLYTVSWDHLVLLPHTIFHTPLCHTPPLTHNFHAHNFSQNFVNHHLSHTHIFLTHHLQPPSLTHIFVTHHLSHTAVSRTTLHIQLVLFLDLPPPPSSLLPSRPCYNLCCSLLEEVGLSCPLISCRDMQSESHETAPLLSFAPGLPLKLSDGDSKDTSIGRPVHDALGKLFMQTGKVYDPEDFVKLMASLGSNALYSQGAEIQQGSQDIAFASFQSFKPADITQILHVTDQTMDILSWSSFVLSSRGRKRWAFCSTNWLRRIRACCTCCRFGCFDCLAVDMLSNVDSQNWTISLDLGYWNCWEPHGKKRFEASNIVAKF